MDSISAPTKRIQFPQQINKKIENKYIKKIKNRLGVSDKFRLKNEKKANRQLGKSQETEEKRTITDLFFQKNIANRHLEKSQCTQVNKKIVT